MPRAVRGVLIEADPAIKSIIVSIDDNENHQYIIQDLDDQRVVVMENMVVSLKAKIEKLLAQNLPPMDDSGSEG